MMDQIVVKNSDDIILIKKAKIDTSNAIKSFESRIDIFDKELTKFQTKVDKNNAKDLKVEEKICKFYNRGFCKKQYQCHFYHPKEICEMFEKNSLCSELNCLKRHPKMCRYWKRVDCRRGQSCAFSHKVSKVLEKEIDATRNEEIIEKKTCVTCESSFENEQCKCSSCNGNICKKCMNGMFIWQQENRAFCKFMNLPYNSSHCSNE